MQYYISPTELQEVGKLFSGDLKNEFIEQVNKLMQLKNNLEWEGPAKEKFISFYEIKVNKLKQFSNIINSFGEFMSYSSLKYDFSTDEVEGKCNDYTNKLK